MIDSEVALEFMRAAVGGVSKTQVIRTFKERYKLEEKDINQLIELCAFKPSPKRIKYKKFYQNAITKNTNAKRLYYPFTQLYQYDNFLSSKECENLRKIIDENLRRSTVSDTDDTCHVSNYRTSSTADLHYFEDPFYLDIDRKLADLLELQPFLGEVMQGQKYLPGEFYKEHYDFFPPLAIKESKTYCEWMGQRTWTTMIYLNDVKEGGETYFKHLKLKVKPKEGMLLAWNNLYRNGFPNYKTMHEALPPIQGNKYVITKWWRSWSLI